VVVEVKRTDVHAELTVRDTGIGIPTQMVSRVFDRFHQADSSTTRRYGGLGLGLAIARELIHEHGGSIEAESPGENLGSTFHVKLPRDRAAVHPGDMAAPPEWAPRGLEGLATLDRVRILVVDDEPDARESITTVLAHCGAEVTPAASVREAMIRFEASQPDVLVADLAMPGEDGYELIRQVRRREKTGGSGLPAIAVTALATAEARRRALAAGFDVHLPKPTEPIEVVAAVARAVRAVAAGGEISRRLSRGARVRGGVSRVELHARRESHRATEAHAVALRPRGEDDVDGIGVHREGVIQPGALARDLDELPVPERDRLDRAV